ncbi:MAG: acyl-CoA dehydrogenase family protein, partial [Streptosporangiaceae bacterium]
MGHFKSNLRDIEFNLFDLLRRQDLLGREPFGEVDEETARGILDEVNRLASGPVAESFADADRHPPVFDPATHSVQMPEGFKRSYQAFVDAEWFRLELPAELGGTSVPRTLAWSVAELILGANPAVWMYATMGSFSRALWELGTPEQRRVAEH